MNKKSYRSFLTTGAYMMNRGRGGENLCAHHGVCAGDDRAYMSEPVAA